MLSLGISNELTFDQLRKLRLVNLYTLLAVCTSLPYSVFFLSVNTRTGIIAFLFFLFLSFTWILNLKEKHTLAKIWLFLGSYAYLFWLASVLGKSSAVQLLLVIVLFSGVILFELKEKIAFVFNIIVCIASFILLEITSYSLYEVVVSESTLRLVYYFSLFIAIAGSISIGFLYALQYNVQIKQKESALKKAEEIERTIHYFSNSLFGKNTIDEILWDVTKNCIGRLGFVDCVIYLLDDERQVLEQRAAFGSKNPREFEIYHPMAIPVGKGIVGHVAKVGKPVLVSDTSKDSRYIADDVGRLSELAVPLSFKNKVIGVIDSEHPDKNFYSEKHLNILTTISALCANKIAGVLAEEERIKALRTKILAEKIKEIDKLKSKLFANISHELRTPLTIMTGVIEDNINLDEDWKLLKSQTDTLLRLINQILDLTKIESRKFKINKNENDIYTLLSNWTAMFESLAASNQVNLKTSIPEKSLWVCIDEDAMEKIIYNLISNAIKFSKPDTEIEVVASYQNRELAIQVKDEGVGIKEEDIPRIFDRFFQVEDVSNTGTGLGLSLTKELVELHGGSIRIESRKNEGTRFSLLFPLEVLKETPKQKNAPSMEVPTQVDTFKKSEIDQEIHQTANHILLIEDHKELANMIISKLNPTYKVTHVLNGESGVEHARENLPDLIISDIMMKGMNGIEACETLKEDELTCHIPIVLLTASADSETKLKGIRTGADDYLTKPFATDELMARIQNLLQQREKLKNKFQKIIRLKPSDIVIVSAEELFIKRLLNAIEEHMDDNTFGVSQLSTLLGMSRMQIHRKLNALTGHSATSFIRTQRLLRASQLLEAGEPVSQVAYSVGFASLSYFTTAYKKQFGILPSHYPSNKK